MEFSEKNQLDRRTALSADLIKWLEGKLDKSKSESTMKPFPTLNYRFR